MKNVLQSKRLKLLGAAIVAVVATGAALGYFTAAGSGSGSAGVGSSVPLTVSPGAPAASLYPGGSSAVVATVSNSNSAAVHIASLSLDTSRGAGGFAVDGSHASCTSPALSFSTATNGGAGWEIAPGSQSLTLSGAIAMGPGASAGCQGATFTVYLVGS